MKINTGKSLVALLSGILLPICIQAQTLCVKKGSDETTFPIHSIDSVRVINNGGVMLLNIYTDSVLKPFLLDEVTAIYVKDRGKGGIVKLSAGLTDKSLPLEIIDSISFEEGAPDTVDSDGDGLSDYNETVKIGSDPRKKDTDGDGWDDGVEMSQFDPNSDPYRFNPVIADLPQLQIVLKSAPQILLVYQTSSMQTEEKSISNATSVTQSTTLSQSFSSSYGQEYGWETGIEAGYEGEGGKFVVSASASGSYSTENVYSWGTETSTENSKSVEQAEAYGKENGITYSGAILRMTVAVKNTGNIGYTVENLGLTAYKVNAADTNFITSIGALGQQGEGGFSSFTLSPGSESGPFVYEYTAANPDQLKSVDVSSLGIITGISGFKISMTDPESQNTIDFTNSSTNVNARTAQVLIDFGPGTAKAAKKFNVATLTHYNENYTSTEDMYFPISLKDVMESLHLSYSMGIYRSNSGLLSIDGFSGDTARTGFWYVIITSPVKKTVTAYCVKDTSYALEDIKVRTGEIVELMYSKDQDGDGVPVRLEQLLGTSDTVKDSDNDSLDDGVELKGFTKNGTVYHTDPSKLDTDGDGLNDKSDPDPIHRALSSSTKLAKITVTNINNSSVTWSTTSITSSSVSCPTWMESQQAVISIETENPVYSLKLNDVSLTPVTGSPKTYTTNATLLPIGNNTFKVKIMSEDLSAADSISLVIPSALETITNLTVSKPASGTYKNLSVSCNWNSIKDTRVAGLVLLRSEKDLSSISINARSTMVAENTNLPGDSVMVAFVQSRPSSGGTVTFPMQDLKANTTYHYKVLTYAAVDAQYWFNNGNQAAGTTTGKINVTASASIYSVDDMGDEGTSQCLELYGSIYFDGVALWNTSSYIDVYDGQSSPTFTGTHVRALNPGDYIGDWWTITDWDSGSGDDLISNSSANVTYGDITGAPVAGTYSGTKAISYDGNAGDEGHININYSFSWQYTD